MKTLTSLVAALGLIVLAATPTFAETVTIGVQQAAASYDPVTEEPVVSVLLTQEGRAALAAFSEDNIGQVIDILVGERVVASPTIPERIDSEVFQLSGRFSREDAIALEQALNTAGSSIVLRSALPAPVK